MHKNVNKSNKYYEIKADRVFNKKRENRILPF